MIARLDGGDYIIYVCKNVSVEVFLMGRSPS